MLFNGHQGTNLRELSPLLLLCLNKGEVGANSPATAIITKIKLVVFIIWKVDG